MKFKNDFIISSELVKCIENQQEKMAEKEKQDEGKWLSRDSPRALHSRVRKKQRPVRLPILRQKKLPKDWRENDNFLTELDLLQPSGGVTKQSSILSYLGADGNSKSNNILTTRERERKYISENDDLLGSCREPLINDTAKSKECNDAEIESPIVRNSQEYFSGTNDGDEKQVLGDANCNIGDSQRNFKSHSQEKEEFHTLSLQRTNEIQRELPSGTEMKIHPGQSMEQNEEKCIRCSQNTIMEDESFDIPKLGDKDRNEPHMISESDNEGLNEIVGASWKRKRHKWDSSSEEELTFGIEGNISTSSYSPLSDSQSVQKEFHKANMGTLRFTEFTNFTFK